ncbi:M20 aminoacylase family protein [Notoacmeibacter sp. MSK16QG-6]|uniref:M20 aminoacylase family protein n=1 Tax=Notoacmeibacter sp. MSK16QG-6 TaxID=2957982 RepID=UPI00209D60D9|nr:M20 aminoacylase family protein [Notoacmeibacter sp. MSK16QG-6]MCP1200750.1 M20 family metallopeptidase [Notoacmeibacter sp. MSK16QG-6]
MALTDHLANRASEIAEWRQDIHANPELLFDVHRTAGFVAERLEAFGCDEVVTGIGRTGVVGLIHGRNGAVGRTIGLRADMDALPIAETTGVPWASKVRGKMHACGHDGHTAMLLGAARELCDERNFNGTVAVIFQPAEEGGAGGRVMVEDGLMERFSIDQVFGMHNLPGLPVGQFGMRTGAIMASADYPEIEILGKGGHAAMPHTTADPMVAAAQMIVSLQTVVSRSTDPLEANVVSITKLTADSSAFNVIPERVTLGGTVRTLSPKVRDETEANVRRVVEGVAAAHGVGVTFRYRRGYPVTVNNASAVRTAIAAARKVAGDDEVITDHPPMMGAEDFAYMLEAQPGAYIFVGNGNSAGLHSPNYDFNDDAIPHGVRYWVALAETALNENL